MNETYCICSYCVYSYSVPGGGQEEGLCEAEYDTVCVIPNMNDNNNFDLKCHPANSKMLTKSKCAFWLCLTLFCIVLCNQMPNLEVLIDWVSQKTALLWCFNLIKCYSPLLQFHFNRILMLFILCNSVQLPLCDVHYTVRRNDHKDEWPTVLQTTGSWLPAAAYWKCNSRCADSSPENFCLHRWRKKNCPWPKNFILDVN